MILQEAKNSALEETKTSGNTQIIYMIFNDGDLINPSFYFCDSEIFENEIENNLIFLPIAETTEENGFNLLPLVLF